MPTYNPKPQDVNKVADYQNQLNSRLSQPKLNSPVMQLLQRQESQDSRSSLERMRASFGRSFGRNQSMTELQQSPKGDDVTGQTKSKVNLLTLAQANSLEELRTIGKVSPVKHRHADHLKLVERD